MNKRWVGVRPIILRCRCAFRGRVQHFGPDVLPEGHSRIGEKPFRYEIYRQRTIRVEIAHRFPHGLSSRRCSYVTVRADSVLQAKESFPVLLDYEGDWVCEDFLSTMLKNSSDRHKRTSLTDEKKKSVGKRWKDRQSGADACGNSSNGNEEPVRSFPLPVFFKRAAHQVSQS